MKKTLIFLALGAIFASCNNMAGDSGQLKKENDSLRTELSKCLDQAGGMKHNPKPQGSPVTINDTCLIDTGTANSNISSYKSKIDSKINNSAWDNSRGILVTRAEIDTAIKYFDFDALVFYLGIDPSTTGVTLMWSPLTGTPGQYTAQYPLNSSGQAAIFNHTMPCPQCGFTKGLGGIDGVTMPHK